jgi:ketosteroid isomerase-like protein
MSQTAPTTREVAQRYMDLLCAGRFADAFDLLADDATYRIIGTTPVSSEMKGRQLIKDTLVGALGSFQQPLQLRCQELIVEGDRAVGLASGEGAGPSGLPYAQPHYAMVLRIEDGRIGSVVEFMDTVAVETALFGKFLVAG